MTVQGPPTVVARLPAADPAEDGPGHRLSGRWLTVRRRGAGGILLPAPARGSAASFLVARDAPPPDGLSSGVGPASGTGSTGERRAGKDDA
jgi:hypothetical protein